MAKRTDSPTEREQGALRDTIVASNGLVSISLQMPEFVQLEPGTPNESWDFGDVNVTNLTNSDSANALTIDELEFTLHCVNPTQREEDIGRFQWRNPSSAAENPDQTFTVRNLEPGGTEPARSKDTGLSTLRIDQARQTGEADQLEFLVRIDSASFAISQDPTFEGPQTDYKSRL